MQGTCVQSVRKFRSQRFLYGLQDFSLSLVKLLSRDRAVLSSERQAELSYEAVLSHTKARLLCGYIHLGSCIIQKHSSASRRCLCGYLHLGSCIIQKNSAASRRCSRTGIITDKELISLQSNAHIIHSRCFCVVAVEEHVAIHQEGCCNSDATQRVHTESSLEQGHSLNMAHRDGLQAFESVLGQIKASGKDADANDLVGLEALLAQAEASGFPSDQHGIGIACYKLAQLFNSRGQPSKVLSYAQRGFKVFKSLESKSAKHAACHCLYAIASAYYGMKEFEKALAQAEHLDLILQKLRRRVSAEEVMFLDYAVQTFLIKCKMSVGRQEETLPHFRKYIELKEKLVEPGDSELGAAYIQVAEAFQEANYSAEAIGYGFKALRIHTEIFGSSSYQVAYVRRLLSEAYYELGHFDDSLCEYDKARPILEAVEDNSLEVMAPFVLKSALSLIELGKYDKAIWRLKEIIENTTETCESHAMALASLGKVYALLNMDKEFLACCKQAVDVLENHQKVSIYTGQNLCLLASSLTNKEHTEQAMLLYSKALDIFNQCPGSEAALKAADTEGEIAIVLLRSGKYRQAAPHVKNYVLRNKIVNGSDNKRLLAVHNRLGAEYLQVGRVKEAQEQLETARLLLSKEITGIGEEIVVALNQNLATVYKVLGRLEDAIECQKAAIEAVKNSEREEIRLLLAEVEKPLEVLS